jgi:hypothetical protein
VKKQALAGIATFVYNRSHGDIGEQKGEQKARHSAQIPGTAPQIAKYWNLSFSKNFLTPRR